MTVYYNEIDPYAAQWLRNLIAAGHIADGYVDERSIEDVTPDFLKKYTQCHFFAGIGVWSHSLRLAGWPDDRPVWTGSCPCQPFSSAGKGKGFADERHLWPAFHYLISECRPPVVFGEQVASRNGLEWLDLVQADLEGTGYTSAAVDLCAAGVGAPHIRQRLYWVAYTSDNGHLAAQNWSGSGAGKKNGWLLESQGTCDSSKLADTDNAVRRSLDEHREDGCDGQDGRRQEAHGKPRARGEVCRMDNNNNKGLEGHGGGHRAKGRWDGAIRPVAATGESGGVADVSSVGRKMALQHTGSIGSSNGERQTDVARGGGVAGGPRPTNGHWRDADWLFCRDGKWRPVEPGTFPLAHGAPARVGRLRAYGNAIVPQVAQVFIESYMEYADALRLRD